MIWAFVIGFVGLCLQAYVSYDDSIQDKWFYYPVGIVLNVIGASLWFYVAKMTTGKETYLAAMIWDGMAAFTFFILPLLLFGVKLNLLNTIGLLFGILGIILMKIGG